jgi:integrase/recombinase XerD
LIHYKSGLSRNTIADYRNSFKKLAIFFPADPPIASITRSQLIDFFAWLADDYLFEPDGAARRRPIKLSGKSRFNIHTNLSALWHWAVDEKLVPDNIVRQIAAPSFTEPVIEPFTKEQIAALLKACDLQHTWKTHEMVASTRSTAERDRAIVLMLLDTGVRAQELCDMTRNNLELNLNRVKVCGKGAGRDGKERTVYFGKLTARSLWKYLLPDVSNVRSDDPIFFNRGDQPIAAAISRDSLKHLLKRLGDRAGIADVHPHRFRHTFAITYLRNGGDLFTLQAMLGHSDLTMVKRYARLAQTDVAAAHRTASPVDNWKL